MNFGEVPDYYRRFIDPVDMIVIKTRRWTPTAISVRRRLDLLRGDHRAGEMRGGRGFGIRAAHPRRGENAVHVSNVDYIINDGSDPLPRSRTRRSARSTARSPA